MIKTFTLLFALFSISCATEKKQTEKTQEPFGVSFQLDRVEDNIYNLSVNIELEKGTYIISPFSKDTTYGQFEISIPENEYFSVYKEITETPNSVEEIDEVLKTPVKFVRVNTTYQKKIRLTSKAMFEVNGMLELLLEPSCVPYDIPFTISIHSGKLKVDKKNTVVSPEYKG